MGDSHATFVTKKGFGIIPARKALKSETGPIIVAVEAYNRPVRTYFLVLSTRFQYMYIENEPTQQFFQRMKLKLAYTGTAVICFFLAFLVISPAQAQQVELKVQQDALIMSTNAASAEEAIPVHRTQELLYSEEGRNALAEYRRLKDLGAYEGAKSGGQTPGTTQNFWVLNFISGISEETEFTLVSVEPTFNIWVETTQLASSGGFVEEQDWVAMASALGDVTPPDSFDPTKGIIEVNESVFGPPSDVDNSGRIDVLVHDVKDTFDPANGINFFTAGFFYPADLVVTNNNPNVSDIIHLDTVPSMFNTDGTRKLQDFVLQTLAHEYQHLIFAVEHGAFDLAFIDEGLAEWAEVVNGYTPRTIGYLSNAGELARNMLEFRQEPFGGPSGEDYERGGLLHHYLAERFSVEAVGAISRGTGQGAGNYTNLLIQNQLDPAFLPDFIQGFHVANLINDQTLSPSFGYENRFRRGIEATGFQTIDGSLNLTSTTSGNLVPGSVRYLKWENVGSFSMDVTASLASQAAHLRPILFLDPADGPMITVTPEVDGETTVVSGNFDEVFLILPHADLTTSASSSFTIDASWQAYTGVSQIQEIVYDNGTVDHQSNGGGLTIIGLPIGGTLDTALPAEDEWANAFDVPVGGALVEVQVSLYFLDLFGLSNSNIRDFTLRIYDDNGGEPGNVILSKELDYFAAQTAPDMSFQTIDLSGDQDVLAAHSGTLYVSVGEAGTDDNHIYMALAESAISEFRSFLYHPFSNTGLNWARFDGVVDQSQNSVFDGLVVPIRATIDLDAGSTDTEDGFELPSAIALEQNYPNPFNPSTQIRFSLPNSSDVQLEVFDMLGRRVASLASGTLPAGTHEVTFDASDLSSGLYLYSIASAGQKITRTMTLVK